MIIIGRHRKLADIINRIEGDFLFFESIADFNRSRRLGPSTDFGNLSASVDALLPITQRSTEKLPQELDLAFAWLRKQQRVPPLKRFAEVTCSRRSFFRKWRTNLTVSPAEFLEELRITYARALLARGYPIHDVIRFAGISSPAELQRLLS